MSGAASDVFELVRAGAAGPCFGVIGVAGGAPLVKCQLLASEFYEAIRQELKKPSIGSLGSRSMLIEAANQSHQIAIASVSPNGMLGELKRAVDLLKIETPACDLSEPTPRSRPVLREKKQC